MAEKLPTSKDIVVDYNTTNDVQHEKRKWHRTTLFNAFVIGGVGFLAPGLWNAMNSLGAGGAQKPFLINAANALVFGLSTYPGIYFGSKS
jgi:hypothetical protein